MQRRWLCASCALLAGLLLAGCGGSGGGGGTKAKSGSITGSVQVSGGSPEQYQLRLDGQPVPVHPTPDGKFTIPGVSPGTHRVSAIGPDGMSGGGGTVTVVPGRPVAMPPIESELGGQIVGMVMKLEDGVLTPLAGVEVVARSDIYWVMGTDGTQTVRPKQGDPGTLIYPPPEGASYSAVTDERGSYLMTAVASGSYLVTVAVPGLMTGQSFVWVDAGHTAAADFQLEPAVDPGVGTIEGTVRTPGGVEGAESPLAGALVEVSPSSPWEPPIPVDPIPLRGTAVLRKALAAADGSTEPGGGGVVMPPIEWRTFSTLTDANGHYSLNVPTGACNVSVTAYGYDGQSASATVRKNETLNLDFLLTAWYPPPVAVPMGR